MEIRSWNHKIAVSRDLRGQATQPLILWGPWNTVYKCSKEFHILTNGRREDLRAASISFLPLSLWPLGPQGISLCLNSVNRGSGAVLGRKSGAGVLKLLLLLTNLVSSAKSPNSHQVQITEDMEMPKGTSAYQGAIGLKDQMREMFKWYMH